jgi:hypothetical protein
VCARSCAHTPIHTLVTIHTLGARAGAADWHRGRRLPAPVQTHQYSTSVRGRTSTPVRQAGRLPGPVPAPHRASPQEGGGGARYRPRTGSIHEAARRAPADACGSRGSGRRAGRQMPADGRAPARLVSRTRRGAPTGAPILVLLFNAIRRLLLFLRTMPQDGAVEDRLWPVCYAVEGRLGAVCGPSVGRLWAVCGPSVGRLGAVCGPSVGQLPDNVTRR